MLILGLNHVLIW